jgi:hypothetical protein
MLIELWESLCGYDKWTPTEATVESSNYSDREVIYAYDTQSPDGSARPETTTVSQSTSVITWKDDSGKEYRNQYTVTSPSPLYEMYGGEKLQIRYNPANPREFYLRELRQGEMFSMIKKAIGVILAIAAGAYWYFWHIGHTN